MEELTGGGSQASLSVQDHRWPFNLLRRPSITEIFNLASRSTPSLLHHTDPASPRVGPRWLSRCVCLCHPAAPVVSAAASGLMGK